MAGRTAVQKILERVTGREAAVGDILFPVAELVTVHDWYTLQVGQALDAFGVERLYDPDRVVFFTDHEPLAVSTQAAARQKAVREIASRFGVRQFFDVGRGGLGHIFGIEAGMARPGLFASGYDTHITSYGAVGCFATAVVTEVSELLACGSVWLKVPRTVRIVLDGALAPGVGARDVAQHLIGTVEPEALDDAVVEFAGPALRCLDLDDRLILVNTPMEVGARTGFVGPDSVTEAYCAARGIDMSLAATTDDDAEIAETIVVNLAHVAPQIAVPPRPDCVRPIDAVAGTAFQHAFIGSCAGGMLADLRAAAAILDGRRIHKHVRLFVTPATQEIAARAASEGLLATFLQAGAIVTAAGCGPCAGGRIGPVADGEVSLNTGTRNDWSRLGSDTAPIYLASAATVAASCLEGVITDPRNYVRGGPW